MTLEQRPNLPALRQDALRQVTQDRLAQFGVAMTGTAVEESIFAVLYPARVLMGKLMGGDE